MTLGRSILISKVALVLVPLSVLTAVCIWQARAGFDQATITARTAFEKNTAGSTLALEEAGFTDLTHQAQDVYAMCLATQEMLEQKLRSDLNVARAELAAAGGVTLGTTETTWQAASQFGGSPAEVKLPSLLIGQEPVTPNTDAGVPSPVVDDVHSLVGGTCTIFQRMNEAGDMLRVCTNVQKKDGTRAIGTFIPAQEPDGKANPVVAALKSGETYTGRAFVVDRWYITCYEPLRDASGSVIGALYVGIPQESAASLRKAIMAMKVGLTGYTYVLNSSGSTRGQYVISYQGKRDGENIWETKDADGKPVIQNICNTATQLKPGEIGEIRYMWKNPQDPTPREKIAKLAYFAPWDWVIGVGAYTDEFRTAVRQLEEQGAAAIAGIENTAARADRNVMVWCGGIGAGAVLLAILVASWMTRRITRPVGRIVQGLSGGASQVNEAAGQVARAAQALAEGNSSQASSLEETSSALEQMAAMTHTNAEHANQANEFAVHARKKAADGEQTMGRLNSAMDAINDSAGKISKIIKVIEEIAFQTNLLALNAAVEAARAGEHGKGFAVVAEEVRNLAQRSATAAKDTTNLIEDSITRAKEGTSVAGAAGQALQSIAGDVAKVADLLEGISRASTEQAQGVEQINLAVSQIDKITQQNAAGAEESASAAEQLSAQSETMRGMVCELSKLMGTQQEVSTRQRASGTHDKASEHIAGVQTFTKKTPSARPAPVHSHAHAAPQSTPADVTWETADFQPPTADAKRSASPTSDLTEF